MALVLHNYFRSSSSIRVRAALNLKGLPYDYIAYHLRKGEQSSGRCLAKNPQALVPALELDDGHVLTQSLAIIEYIDEVAPAPSLLPPNALDRAYVRSIAYAIACEIHPINNLRVLAYLRQNFGADEATVAIWFRNWVEQTFSPLEQIISQDSRRGRFCVGDEPGLADICILAQVTNNQRFGVDMTAYPVLQQIYDACLTIPAFRSALPDKQPDSE